MTAAATTIFFATDLHGSELCFRKFLGAASFYRASVLFLGGDLSGKGLVWIRKSLRGGWSAQLDGQQVALSTRAELIEFERRVANRGLYTAEATDEEIQNDAAAIMESRILSRATTWMDRASELLQSAGASLFVIPGNDDPWSIDSVLTDRPGITFVDRRVACVAPGISVVGLGCSTHTPWNTPREATEEQIDEELKRLLSPCMFESPAIFDVHVPPYGSGIDLCPELGEDKQVRIGPGGPVLQAVGSRAVRDAVERYKPALGLFGHVHESRGFTKIGRTLCVNPGSSYADGRLLGAIITMSGAQVRSWHLTDG